MGAVRGLTTDYNRSIVVITVWLPTMPSISLPRTPHGKEVNVVHGCWHLQKIELPAESSYAPMSFSLLEHYIVKVINYLVSIAICYS